MDSALILMSSDSQFSVSVNDNFFDPPLMKSPSRSATNSRNAADVLDNSRNTMSHQSTEENQKLNPSNLLTGSEDSIRSDSRFGTEKVFRNSENTTTGLDFASRLAPALDDDH